jgi:hypothetical protein
LGWDGKGGVRWAEQRVVDWVMRDALPTKDVVRSAKS